MLYLIAFAALLILGCYILKDKHRSNKIIMLALACSGAAALIYQVVATQALTYFFNSSTYSVTTVVVSFLLGLALGSLIMSRYLPKIVNKYRLFFALQVVIALYAVTVFTQYDFIPNLLVHLYAFSGNSFILSLIIKFLIGAAYLLPPTIMLGASFPLASSIVIKDINKAGSDVGRLYFWDLFGAISGAAAAGFILIPGYGLTATFLFGAALNIFAGILIVGSIKIVPVAAVIFLVMLSSPLGKTNYGYQLLPSDNINLEERFSKQGTNLEEHFLKNDVLFFKSSPYGEVRVVKFSEDDLRLYINRRIECSTLFSESERKIADLVLDKTKSNADVLNVGLGCGFTLNSILRNENTGKADMVEINPAVVEASKHFKEAVDSLNDQRANLIIDDAANYLTVIEKKYDAIIIDVENPAIIHSSPLYTVEYFNIIKKRLNEDGLFGLWAYRGDYEYEKILYKSLRTAFKNVVRLRESAGTPHALVFIASDGNITYDMTEEELSRIKTLEQDGDYRLNTIDHNILAEIYSKSIVNLEEELLLYPAP